MLPRYGKANNSSATQHVYFCLLFIDNVFTIVSNNVVKYKSPMLPIDGAIATHDHNLINS